ncbi:2,3-butanediol dehydrogenase [Mycobacteroides chelonae]|uniref:2,3-butanediol dehydrogenase n=1 Tax=Mycobacteroides chelonae TaxID=1774 RepID=UPI0018E3D6B8|nr:2,3-butanediol dehydrogenase [Mycobacteroides chelonae]
MRALRLYGPQDIRLDDVPEPQVLPGSVKIAVDWSGICGSDLHAYARGPVGSMGTGGAHPITGEVGPRTLGHEFAGRIVQIGDAVTGLVVGDAVAVEPILYDGTCIWCRQGSYNLCEKMGFVGLDGWGGGFSEFVALPAHMVHRLPADIGTDMGALIEPLSVAWGALNRSQFTSGETALVIGAGPIGLALVLCLQAMGATGVFVSEPSRARRAMASSFGANVTIDPRTEDVAEVVRGHTDELGAHVAFDTSGFKSTLDSALSGIRKHGRVVNLALWEHQVEIDPMALLAKEIDYTASNAYSRGTFAEVISCISSGRLTPEPMVTSKIKLDDIVESGFGELLANRDRHVKILVHP